MFEMIIKSRQRVAPTRTPTTRILDCEDLRLNCGKGNQLEKQNRMCLVISLPEFKMFLKNIGTLKYDQLNMKMRTYID